LENVPSSSPPARPTVQLLILAALAISEFASLLETGWTRVSGAGCSHALWARAGSAEGSQMANKQRSVNRWGANYFSLSIQKCGRAFTRSRRSLLMYRKHHPITLSFLEQSKDASMWNLLAMHAGEVLGRTGSMLGFRTCRMQLRESAATSGDCGYAMGR
jgi:hypothetical protein